MSRYHQPLDPDCPIANDFIETLNNDPMTAYSGCGDEIVEDFERKHRRSCARCTAYGVANIEIE